MAQPDIEGANKPYAIARLFFTCLFVSGAMAMAIWYGVNWLLDHYGYLLGEP